MTLSHLSKPLSRKNLTATLFLAVLNGCAYGERVPPSSTNDEPAPSVGTHSKGTGGAASAAPEATDVTTPFADFVSQKVQWFDKDVTVKSASTRIRTVPLSQGDVLEQRDHKIELRVQNRTSVASDLGWENWDLILQDGTRLGGGPASTSFGPHDALNFDFNYEDSTNGSLEGAFLELNGITYGDYEPLVIPLDKLSAEPPKLVVSELVGQVFTCDEESNFGCWRHEVTAAEVSMSSDAPNREHDGGRAKPGKKLFALSVRVTTTKEANLWASVFHLSVDGYGESSDTYVNELPKAGERMDIAVVFQIDADATELDVEFDTDAFTNGATWKTFHVDLSEATVAP